MSNTRWPDAKLPGYWGPYFPRGLEKIQMEVFSKYGQRFTKLDWCEIGQRVPAALASFVGVIACPTTSDGHDWYCSIHFNLELTVGKRLCEMAVLFPWGQDLKWKHRTYADRHIAVYLKNTDNVDAAQRIVEEMLSAMLENPNLRRRKLLLSAP